MSSWFYELLNEQFGPTSEQEIRELIELGSLSDTDRLRAVDSNQWITVAEFLAAADDSAFATELSDLNFEFGDSGVHSSTASRPTAASSIQTPVEQPAPVNLYFCQILGQTLGPMELHDLIPMFEGELSSGDLVRCGENGPWGPAKSFPELIPFLPPPRKSARVAAPSEVDAKIIAARLSGEPGRGAQPGTQTASGNTESPPVTKSGRGSRPKGQKKEDALIDQLLSDVLMSGTDEPPKSSIQRLSDVRTLSESDSRPAVSQTVVSSEPPPASLASRSASVSTPPARYQAKSPSKSRFSDDEFRQKLTKIGGGIVVIGIAVWAFMTFQIPGFPVSSAVRAKYVSRMKEVYTELAALDPKASDAGLERYREIITSEFAGYLTELRKADSDDDASVRCAVALDEFLKFSEEEFRDKSDLEKHLGPLKRSLDRLN